MMISPTLEQAEQCSLVQGEAIEMIDRLVAEGIDLRVILPGMSAALTAALVHHHGPAEAAKFFAIQSAITMSMAKVLN